jgi:uncharacterized protein YrrD
MKASEEIRGLRIISISDGTQVGTVKDLILNPHTGSLDFFIVDQPADYFGAKIIPFNDIIGLGEFALTLPSPQVIQDVSQNPVAQELLKQGVAVIGTKVLTKKGSLIGEVQEILIDEETGKISECVFSNSKGERHQARAQQIITYGKELLIIDGDLVPNLTSIPSSDSTKIATMNVSESEWMEKNIQKSEDASNEADQPSQETEFNLFEQRQLQYFLGKDVIKDVVLDNGDILSAGEPMTEEVIRKITTRSKLMEITSYLHKN